MHKTISMNIGGSLFSDESRLCEFHVRRFPKVGTLPVSDSERASGERTNDGVAPTTLSFVVVVSSSGPFIVEDGANFRRFQVRRTIEKTDERINFFNMMPTMPPDSHKISLKIIEAVKQHPVLFINDVKGTTIKVQEFRQKVWKRISDELGLDPVWVRLKWKNLRDTYCRILKYKNKTDKGGRRKKWIFEDHLNFLKFPYEPDYQPQCVELTDEYIREINEGSISSEGLLEQLEDKIDEDYSEYLEVLEETTADPVLGDSEMDGSLGDVERQQTSERVTESETQSVQQQEIQSYARQIQSKYRKIRPKKTKIDQAVPIEISSSYSILKSPDFKNDHQSNNVIDATSIAPIIITSPSIVPGTLSTVPFQSSRAKRLKKDSTTGESKEEPNNSPSGGKTSIELFFNSMAQTVKLLPLKAQVDIKMAVCRIVTEAEVQYSKYNTSKNTQQFIAPPGMIPKLVLVPCSMIDSPSKG